MKYTTLCCIALAAACGGSGASTQAFVQSAPTFDKFAIAQNDSDTAAPAAAPGGTDTQALTSAGPDCHPHLFARTGEIISHVNRHFFKMLTHAEDLIKNNPLTSGESKTWENVKNGIDRKLVMTLEADGSYSFVLTLSNGTTTATVMTGSIDTTTSGTVTETKGSATFDYSALASVVTTEKSTGQITDTFDIVKDTSKPAPGEKRTASMTLTNFHFDDDLHGPRNGSYSWEREPGVGGKFQFTDSLVLLCPANPSLLDADLTAVARWYKSSDGSVHGRSDAKATGGQIAAGDTWMGVTCAQGATTTAPAEGYWMMKLEDSSGATVAGAADTLGSTPCDSIFGAVPSVTNNASDYDFTAAVTFPNEW